MEKFFQSETINPQEQIPSDTEPIIPQEETSEEPANNETEQEIELVELQKAYIQEKGLMERLYDSRWGTLARACVLGTFLLLAQGCTFPHTKKDKNLITTQVEKEKSLGEFIVLSPEQKQSYLENFAHQSAGYQKNVTRFYFADTNYTEYKEQAEFSKTEKDGFEKITELKKILEKKYNETKNSEEKKKFYDAFLAVHTFMIEHNITDGKQEILIYNNDGYISINEQLQALSDGKPIEQDLKINLKKLEHYPLLKNFFSKLEKIKGSGSELSQIRQVYNLVAIAVPFYSMQEHDLVNNVEKTFNDTLSKGTGLCVHKNALLITSLRHIGIRATSITGGKHYYTRVHTSQGILDIDVTRSQSFNLSKPAQTPSYEFETEQTNLVGSKLIPSYIQKYTKQDGNSIVVRVPLTSPEGLRYIKTQYGNIPPTKLRTLLSHYQQGKTHPLYRIKTSASSHITPHNARQFLSALFPRLIQPNTQKRIVRTKQENYFIKDGKVYKTKPEN